MNDLAKTEDMLSLRGTMKNDARGATGLERADLGRASECRTLPNQIGRRLRTVFPAPQIEQEDEFDSLLKQISALLP
jgi:hypothetical protein